MVTFQQFIKQYNLNFRFIEYCLNYLNLKYFYGHPLGNIRLASNYSRRLYI
jgi:hypothetical protein